MTERIKLFVGCSANGEDAESLMVLEYTARKHCSMPLDIVWMKQSKHPESFWYTDKKGQGWHTDTWATPFSGFRWAIPAACNYQGKAIYMDSDMIVMDDLAKLWNQKFDTRKIVMAKGGTSWRFCVSMWDCKEAKLVLPEIDIIKKVKSSHQELMAYFSSNPRIVQSFNGNWNCIDGENYNSLFDPEIKTIHYSDMSTQCHLELATDRLSKLGLRHWFDGDIKDHPREDLSALFLMMYDESIKAGYLIGNYIPNEDEYFGYYVKESQKEYQGNQFTRPNR